MYQINKLQSWCKEMQNSEPALLHLIHKPVFAEESFDTTECVNDGQRTGWYFAHVPDDLTAQIAHVRMHFSLDAVMKQR